MCGDPILCAWIFMPRKLHTVMAILEVTKNFHHYERLSTATTFTTTKEGYIAIQISSQTTKKKVSENPQLRTTISRKLLSCYETITFAPVQSQVLRNSRNWYNRKTFLIIISSIHHLQFPVHQKLFATNPSLQRLSKST